MMTADMTKMTQAELIATIAALRAQAAKPTRLSLKVSAKGAVSLYGMGKWPVTLYRTQWERLLDDADAIRAFIAANVDKLATKD